ncbi:MAG TPA: hypothetical protein VKA15_10355, partial [Isosphaeraceae bacterium]|nr:hypothetical protein [Isosphaeraceae bacterium]
KGAASNEYIDYTNIADLTFNAALLNSMTKVQRLKAPEGWPVLAPYAAILLEDESLKTIQKDGDITSALDRLRKWREQRKPEVEALIERLDALMGDIRRGTDIPVRRARGASDCSRGSDGQECPSYVECLSSWKLFLSAKIDDTEAISHLLNALDTSFGYSCYAQQEAKTTELDDLATRKKTWEKAEAFCRHDQKIRAAHHYSQLQVKRDGPVGGLKDKLRALGKKLENVSVLMESEAKLQSQLLDPLDSLQTTCKTRYLQAFDELTGKCEAVRTEIDKLPEKAEFTTVAELVKIDALGTLDVGALRNGIGACKAGLFDCSLDRNGVERALKDRPLPEGCALHVDEAGNLIETAEKAQEQAKSLVRSALVSMAKLLRQPALVTLLNQGAQEPFIAEVLNTADADKLADLLARRIPADRAHPKVLDKYLKRIVVRVVRLQDFHPSKATIEKGDIDEVVGEFRQFLESAVDGDGKSQSTILEIR